MRFHPTFMLALLTANAVGAVVNIDFNFGHGDEFVAAETYSGTAAAPDSGTVWNSMRRNHSGAMSSSSSMNPGPLYNSNGLATSVTLGINTLTNATIAHQRATSGNHEQNIASEMMFDYLQVNAQTPGGIGRADGTIGGLVAGGLYELYFYGQGADNSPNEGNRGQNSLFGITQANGSLIGSSQQTGYDGTPGGDGDLDQGVEYVRFTATADNSGRIFFFWSNVIAGTQEQIDLGLANALFDAVPNGENSGSPFGAWNGLQIRQIPEPSPALLLALGLGGVLARRRRVA